MADPSASGFTFLPLGVGDAFSARHYSSCVALEAEGSTLLVDCPHPIQKMLREASVAAGEELTVERISGVALTHLHADHCSGIEDLGFFFHYVLGRKLTLLAHPAVVERLWSGHLAAGMELVATGPGQPFTRRKFSDFFELVELSEQSAVRYGPFSIECRRTLHHVPTTALRVTAAGRCLGHSADTEFDPSLLAWLSRADLFLHETGPGTHSHYEDLAALPPSDRAKMRLTHYSDPFDPAKSIIEALREGRRYRV
ncbi:MAG: MBL fold metallo-hydrolase [Myxococcaceae bacterium]